MVSWSGQLQSFAIDTITGPLSVWSCKLKQMK